MKGLKIMKKHMCFLMICIFAFIAGYSINSKAISDTGYRVAVVDIQALISKSSEVNALKADQQRKIDAMKATVDKAREEISKETDPIKIAQLEEKYRNDINNQKNVLDNEYNIKLKQIDTNIKNLVVAKAKGLQYNVVLPKSIVLFGGDDITNEVAKSVK